MLQATTDEFTPAAVATITVGADDVVGDATQVLFVRGDEAFRTSHPLPAGYAELIITPAIDVLSEIANAEGVHLRAHPLFRYRSRRCPPELQTLRRAAAGTLSRARWYRLEAHLGHSIRLADAARAVGASPAYLTHVFRRFEGASLHQYLIHLRLARALAELRHADDLTSLALDLGFSSHSHFSAGFRRRYGLTPSQFRDGTVNRTPDASAAGASGVEEMQP